MDLSIIIPTFNEEAVLRSCISGIRRLDPDIEIIVADGGSSDNTINITRSSGVLYCQSGKGRGIQLNTGASLASGEVLLFLHADTRLPDKAPQKIREIFSDHRVNCGTFRLSFDINHWFLGLLSFMMRFTFGYFCFGDQCLVVRRSFFEAIGRFPEWRLYEDLEFISRARKKTRILRFPMTVTTSARRFQQNGMVRQQIRNVWYTILYLLGTSPDNLASRYERQKPSSHDSYLAMILRYPSPGSVKTRLAATIGDIKAAEFYKKCVSHLISETGKLPGRICRHIWYTGASEKEMAEWLDQGLKYFPQSDGSLGNKLKNIFNVSFDQGAKKVVTVAGDVPDLSSELIMRAFRELDGYDVVIGPTYDGGYYLLGMKQLHNELFRGILWGTDAVYTQTVDRISKLGLKLAALPVLNDIDTWEDLLNWHNLSRHSSFFGVPEKSGRINFKYNENY